MSDHQSGVVDRLDDQIESDSSLPSLVESETDSDEEDYRQLEAQELIITSSSSNENPAISASTSRVGVVTNAAAGEQEAEEDEGSDDDIPSLVDSSSSEDELEENMDVRNVRPRHSAAGPAPSGTGILPPSQWRQSGGRTSAYQSFNTANLQDSVLPNMNFVPSGANTQPVLTMPLRAPGQPSARSNRRTYQTYWNSATAPSVAPRVTWQSSPGAPMNAEVQMQASFGAPGLNLLSSILGAQFQRLGGTHEFIADIRDMPLDPILQVLQASFNLMPQRKPTPAKEALDSVLIVRIGEDDTETTCPISADTVKVGEWAARMPCGHYFGKHDLFEWLGVNNSCPVCRFELPTDDVQYNEQKRLSVKQVVDAAASACQAEDDIIGKRMGLVREALLQRILDESSDSLCVSVQAWSYKEEAALAAAKREALNRYYELEKSGMEADMKAGIEAHRDRRMHLDAPMHDAAMQPHLNAPIHAHIPAEQDACYGSEDRSWIGASENRSIEATAPPPLPPCAGQSSQQLESGSNASSHPLHFFQSGSVLGVCCEGNGRCGGGLCDQDCAAAACHQDVALFEQVLIQLLLSRQDELREQSATDIHAPDATTSTVEPGAQAQAEAQAEAASLQQEATSLQRGSGTLLPLRPPSLSQDTCDSSRWIEVD